MSDALQVGPADPDHFRVAVGRYNDRWYHDPLPADAIADATDEVFPSVSTCKKASGSDWSFVALKRVNHALNERPDRFVGMSSDERRDALASINKVGLTLAAQRGTNVHLMCESRLKGTKAIIGDNAPGAEYRQAVDDFFDTYQPTLVAAEFVVINRTLNGAGYGGTCDALISIDGKTYFVDWKSRGDDSVHGAYPEEGAQVGGYYGGDYMIVEGEHGPERRRMPHVDGGLIVSIKPDGARVYPIDLDAAFTHWSAMHGWWVARRDERKAIGRTWAPRKSKGALTADELQMMDDHASEPHDPAPPAEQLCHRPGVDLFPAEPLSRGEQLSKVRSEPDEGGDADLDAFAVLERRYHALTPNYRAWIGALASDALRNHVPFATKNKKVVRRFELLRGLVHLSENDQADDEILRALLFGVIGDVALFTAVTPGHLLGSLDVEQAEQFSHLVDLLAAGRMVGSVDEVTGAFHLAATTAA